MDLRISRALIEAIRNETAAAAPQECCGLLLGDRAALRVDAILPAANVAAEPVHCFEIDPTALLAAHKEARAGGPEIVGHYHSHPRGAPIPSTTDAAHAQGTGEIWVITGMNGEMRAWLAGADGTLHGCFSSVRIIPTDETGLAPASAHRH